MTPALCLQLDISNTKNFESIRNEALGQGRGNTQWPVVAETLQRNNIHRSVSKYLKYRNGFPRRKSQIFSSSKPRTLLKRQIFVALGRAHFSLCCRLWLQNPGSSSETSRLVALKKTYLRRTWSADPDAFKLPMNGNHSWEWGFWMLRKILQHSAQRHLAGVTVNICKTLSKWTVFDHTQTLPPTQ